MVLHPMSIPTKVWRIKITSRTTKHGVANGHLMEHTPLLKQQVFVIPENWDPAVTGWGFVLCSLQKGWVLDWDKGTHGYPSFQRCGMITKSTTEFLISLSLWLPLQPQTQFCSIMRISLSFPSSVPHSPVAGMWIWFWVTTGFVNEYKTLGLAEIQVEEALYSALLIHHTCLGLSPLLLQRKINFCLV